MSWKIIGDYDSTKFSSISIAIFDQNNKCLDTWYITDETKEFNNLDDNWYVKINTTPNPPYSFRHWYYEVNGSSDTSKAKEFLCFGATGKTLYIEPVANPEWGCVYTSITLNEGTNTFMPTLNTWKIRRYTVVSTVSGTVKCSVTSSFDTIFYLSSSPEYGSLTGAPSYISKQQNNGGQISWDVQGNTKYYIFVRADDGDNYGMITVTFDVTKSSSVWQSNFDTNDIIVPKNTTAITRTLAAGDLCRVPIVFTQSGEVTISQADKSGSPYTYGYLSTSTDWDSESGKPLSYLQASELSNTRFTLTENVITTQHYYLWFRGQNLSASGSVNVSFTFGQPIKWKLDYSLTSIGVSTTLEKEYTLDAGKLYRVGVNFNKSGEVKISTTGNTCTWGYLTTSKNDYDLDEGKPLSWLGKSEPSDLNFDITCNVNSDTTYYFWFRGKDETISGKTNFIFTLNEAQEPEDDDQYTVEFTSASYSSVKVKINKTAPYIQAYIIEVDTGERVGLASRFVNITNLSISLYNRVLTKNKYYKVRVDFFSKCPDTTVTGSAYKDLGDDIPFDTSKYFITSAYTTSFKLTTDPSWTRMMITSKFNNLQDKKETEDDLGFLYRINRYTVSFTQSGKATFWTKYVGGHEDLVKDGYLSTDSTYNTSNGVPNSTFNVSDYSHDGIDFKFSYDVVAGTTYYLWIRSRTGLQVGNFVVHILPPGVEPDEPSVIQKWTWEAQNYANGASVEQVTKAYNVVLKTDGFVVRDFSYLVWNDMVDKVNEIIGTIKGESWDETYASYANTKMQPDSESTRTLTATKFNSLRYNIGIRYSTGINEVKPGDIVYGDYFITLANCINDWIDSLLIN